MKDIDKIMDEEDPYLREIWWAGYDAVRTDHLRNTIELIMVSERYVKVIQMPMLLERLTVVKAVLPNGKRCDWLSSKDGSDKKFQQIIKPELE